MNIIDAHVHFSRIESFYKTARDISGVDYSLNGLKKEFERNGVVLGIGMGVTEQGERRFPDKESPNPMILDMEEEVPAFLMECAGINPVRLAGKGSGLQAELDRIEARLKHPAAAGIKLYAGYYHYYVHDDVYEPVYELARAYNLPVVIHTGDTYSSEGLLKYSHPLTVDELAVKHRDITFMICHMGDPWVMDGAEIVYKNPNVYADLSGLLVTDRRGFDRYMSEPLLMDHFRRALVYGNVYDKFLFGTDWPLAPIDSYIRFVQQLIPDKYAENVFYRNALRVFPRLESRLAENGIGSSI